MIRWSDVMEEHKEQLIEALEQAFKEAVDCRYMQYITEIYQDGTIRTWSCAAVSNSFSHDSYVGKSHEVKRFCFHNMDIEITEEDFRRHMSINEQNEAEMLAEENGDSFIGYILSSGHYGNLIEECENEYLEWYKDEYAYSEAREAVERNIEDEWRTEINEERERMCY